MAFVLTGGILYVHACSMPPMNLHMPVSISVQEVILMILTTTKWQFDNVPFIETNRQHVLMLRSFDLWHKFQEHMF